MSGWRCAAPFAVVGAAVVLTIGVEANARPTEAKGQSLSIGQRAPAFSLPVMTTDRRSVFRFADHVGPGARKPKNAVVLNFAASYCEPCKGELAALKRYAAALRSANVTVVVIVIDTEPAGIREMLDLTTKTLALGPPFVVVSDRFGVLARRYRADTLPMSVVVGRGGKIRWTQTGFKPGSVERLMAVALPHTLTNPRPAKGAGAVRP